MSCIHIRTVISVDGELHLANLPCRKGDEVDAVVSFGQPSQPQGGAARQRLIEHARSSQFYSSGPYPTREELHGRT
jgi:uncharacterized protein (UPF0218 family)